MFYSNVKFGKDQLIHVEVNPLSYIGEILSDTRKQNPIHQLAHLDHRMVVSNRLQLIVHLKGGINQINQKINNPQLHKKRLPASSHYRAPRFWMDRFFQESAQRLQSKQTIVKIGRVGLSANVGVSQNLDKGDRGMKKQHIPNLGVAHILDHEDILEISILVQKGEMLLEKWSGGDLLFLEDLLVLAVSLERNDRSSSLHVLLSVWLMAVFS